MEICEFIKELPDKARTIVDQVLAIGLPVSIRLKSESGNSVIKGGPFLAYLDKAHSDAVIYIEREAPAHIIFHEFLHLHRSWVLCIPEMWDRERGQSNLVFSFENAIEHFKVVIDEIDCFPEAKIYWDFMLIEALSSYEQGNINNQKMNLFLHYRLCILALQETKALESCTNYVQKNNWFDDFEAWNTELDILSSNKFDTCKKILRYSFPDMPIPEALGVRSFEYQGSGKPFIEQFIPFN